MMNAGRRTAAVLMCLAATVGACGSDAGPSSENTTAAPPAALPTVTPSDRPAFPGAEGHGRGARGGRGGKIIAVTTLADGGPGSLRACIDAAGPRVCIFRVAGLIRYTNVRPMIRNPYITIAGETAPGDGILIAHNGGKGATTPFVVKGTHDVVVRHIRVRNDRDGELRRSDSAFIIERSDNVILDHVSASWARDENVGGYSDNDRITISWSIFAQGTPRHDKCALMASDPTKPQRFSFLHNLCAHNGDRNPDVNFPPGSCVEVVNNVLYDASLQFTEVWESYGGTPVNIVGNVYRRGPSTSRLAYAVDRPLEGSKGKARIYLAGNVIDGKGLEVAPVAQEAIVAAPVCPLTVKPLDASDAYPTVLTGSGAFPRDSFDRRMVEEVRSRSGHIGMPDRTLPILAAGTPYSDRDGDGMSDRWEIAHGLDPDRNDAWGDIDGNGWANLEEFLNHAHQERLAGRAPD